MLPLGCFAGAAAVAGAAAARSILVQTAGVSCKGTRWDACWPRPLRALSQPEMRPTASRPVREFRSRTRMPDTGRSPSGSFSGGLSPIFRISINGNEAIRHSLWMLRPFGHAAHHAAGADGGDDRPLELERIPLRDGPSPPLTCR